MRFRSAVSFLLALMIAMGGVVSMSAPAYAACGIAHLEHCTIKKAKRDWDRGVDHARKQADKANAANRKNWDKAIANARKQWDVSAAPVRERFRVWEGDLNDANKRAHDAICDFFTLGGYSRGEAGCSLNGPEEPRT